MVDFTKKYQVMGILNVTPDSFSDGGEHFDTHEALLHAQQLIADGAAILDIGGQSTRPGYVEVSPAEEIARIVPVIRELKKTTSVPLSVDTYFPEVAEAAIAAGCDIINDIRGLDTPGMLAVLAKAPHIGIIIMHSRPRRKELTVAQDIQSFYLEKYEACLASGIDPQRLCFDPGVGFGKTPAENVTIIREPEKFRFRDFPVLYGVSRKRTIEHLTDEPDLRKRDYGTIAASLFACDRDNVEILRVHNVKGMVDGLKVWSRLKNDDAHV